MFSDFGEVLHLLCTLQRHFWPVEFAQSAYIFISMCCGFSFIILSFTLVICCSMPGKHLQPSLKSFPQLQQYTSSVKIIVPFSHFWYEFYFTAVKFILSTFEHEKGKNFSAIIDINLNACHVMNSADYREQASKFTLMCVKNGHKLFEGCYVA